jgi:hypothetical protein
MNQENNTEVTNAEGFRELQSKLITLLSENDKWTLLIYDDFNNPRKRRYSPNPKSRINRVTVFFDYVNTWLIIGSSMLDLGGLLNNPSKWENILYLINCIESDPSKFGRNYYKYGISFVLPLLGELHEID